MKRFIPAAAALALLAAVPAAAQDQPTAQYGSFSYFHRTDPINDAETSVAGVAEEGVDFMPANLLWQCERDGSYHVLFTTQLITMDDQVRAEWRFDQGPPQSGTWNVMQAHIMWIPEEAADAFTTTARTAQRLALRLSDSNGNEKTMVFPLNGADAAFAKLGCMAPKSAGAPSANP